jgi:hypothetical protein
MKDPMYHMTNIGDKRSALAEIYHRYCDCKRMINLRDEQGWRKACIELRDSVEELDSA